MWLRVVLFGIPTLALLTWVHIYLYRRLVKPIQRKWLRIAVIAWAATALLVTMSVRFLGPIMSSGLATGLLLWGGFLLYTFMLTLASGGAARFMPERRALFERASIVAAAGFTGYGAYRAFEGPEINEVVVPIQKLPKHLEGLRIVQLTDIHVGAVIQTKFLETLVEKANALKPDITVITGDLVDGTVRALGEYVKTLGRLQARFDKYFVTGNHDYYSGADAWVAFMQQLGFNVLRNRSVTHEGLRIIGVDDWSAARFGDAGYDLDEALKDAHLQDEASVLFAHQPANFDEAVAAGIGLQLSGHTHGGQLFPATLGAYAIWQGRNRGLTKLHDSHLYVSKGCGFVGPPMRIGSPPEIASIVLVSA